MADTTPPNEAAERLRFRIRRLSTAQERVNADRDLDASLAAARQQTIQRVRDEIGPRAESSYTTVYVNDVHDWLDAIAGEGEQ